MSEIVQRQNELFALADQFKRALHNWQADDSLLGVPIEGELWQAADQLVAGFTDGMLPASCRRIAESVAEFARPWREFREMAATSNDPNAMPTTDCMKAAGAICEKRTMSIPRPPKMLEPIQELVAQKVTDSQIAIMKEWLDADGNPDLNMVRRAKANPEKYDKLYQDSGDAKLAEQLAEDKRTTDSAADKVQRFEAMRANEPTETAVELIQSGVSPAQAADILGCSEDDVIQECYAHGMELTDIYQQGDGSLDMRPELSEEAERNMAGQANMAGRKFSSQDLAAEAEAVAASTHGVDSKLITPIVSAHNAKMPSKQIAGIFSLTIEQVNAVLIEQGLLPPKGENAA